MHRHMFYPGLRVSAKHELRTPKGGDGTTLKKWAKGTVAYAGDQFISVQFDDLDHEICLSPRSLMPITLDELFAVQPEYWHVIRPAGGDHDAA